MPPLPPEVAYVWGAWNRIRRRKAGGFSGPLPIDWSDIDCFVRRSGMTLSPFEVGLIEIIDDAFLQSVDAGPSPSEARLANMDSVQRLSRAEGG